MDLDLVNINFEKCIKGWHLINSSVINETIWEDINIIIFNYVGIEVYSKSNGSHLPGMDIDSSFGKISNKSAKYSKNKKSIDISSYRLTTVCSDNNYGNISDIIDEINKRKNYDYYSLIVRNENNDNIEYDWYMIPSNYLILEPDSYEWKPIISKKGRKIDMQIGWTTNEIDGSKMSIYFNMSSQLWIHINITDEIKKFIIASVKIINKPKYNYIELYEKLGDTI
jgi:hypothetical protein